MIPLALVFAAFVVTSIRFAYEQTEAAGEQVKIIC